MADLFAVTDRGDLEAVVVYLHDDVQVVFGNNDPIRGKDAYKALYRQLTATLRGIRHQIHAVWHTAENTDLVIAAMTVHYTRLDERIVSVPCCNVLQLGDGLIRRYQVYLDIGPVFDQLH